MQNESKKEQMRRDGKSNEQVILAILFLIPFLVAEMHFKYED